MTSDWDVQSAAMLLLETLHDFASAHSNPVMSLLPHDSAPIEGQHYPSEPFRFAGSQLRAYYHSHPREHRFAGEHGHFHIFLQSPNSIDVVHLIALCMDPQGQPLRWFITNHWVTGGAWLPPEELRQLFIQSMSDVHQAQLGLVERWIWSMLGTFAGTIMGLIGQREQVLACLGGDRAEADVLVDRGIYLLGESEINLLGRFEEVLAT